ncbi:MAG: hypothetical protein Q9181_005680 [Wetmoreana brouardii]
MARDLPDIESAPLSVPHGPPLSTFVFGPSASTPVSPSAATPGSMITRPRSLPELPTSAVTTLPRSSPVIQQEHAGTTRPYITSGPSTSVTLANWSPSPTSPTSFSPLPGSPAEDDKATEGHSIVQRLFDRSWVQPSIGLTTLLITLIALFVYSHRSFVMAKWTEENDMLQACAQLYGIWLNRTYPRCDKMLASGPRPPPYLKGKMYPVGGRADRIQKRVVNLANGTPKLHRLQDYAASKVGLDQVQLGPGYMSQTYGQLILVVCAVCALAFVTVFGLLTHNRRRRSKDLTTSFVDNYFASLPYPPTGLSAVPLSVSPATTKAIFRSGYPPSVATVTKSSIAFCKSDRNRSDILECRPCVGEAHRYGATYPSRL